jgi:hypothetical protein
LNPREADAQDQVQRVLAGDGVIHQVLQLRLVGGLAIDENLASAGDDCLIHQALFVEAIAGHRRRRTKQSDDVRVPVQKRGQSSFLFCANY